MPQSILLAQAPVARAVLNLERGALEKKEQKDKRADRADRKDNAARNRLLNAPLELVAIKLGEIAGIKKNLVGVNLSRGAARRPRFPLPKAHEIVRQHGSVAEYETRKKTLAGHSRAFRICRRRKKNAAVNASAAESIGNGKEPKRGEAP